MNDNLYLLQLSCGGKGGTVQAIYDMGIFESEIILNDAIEIFMKKVRDYIQTKDKPNTAHWQTFLNVKNSLIDKLDSAMGDYSNALEKANFWFLDEIGKVRVTDLTNIFGYQSELAKNSKRFKFEALTLYPASFSYHHYNKNELLF